MDYKFLFLLTLLITLVLVLVKFKKELFFNDSKKLVCDNDNDVKYIINRKTENNTTTYNVDNSYGIACNLKEYVAAGAFYFNKSEKGHILLDLGDENTIFDIIHKTLRVQFKGIGPIFHGKNWSLLAETDILRFKCDDMEDDIEFNINSRVGVRVDISFDDSNGVLRLRLNQDNNTIQKRIINNSRGPNLARFDIGRGYNRVENEDFFDGIISGISLTDKLFGTGFFEEEEEEEDSDVSKDELFTKIIDLLLNLKIDEFTNYKNKSKIEHFQGSADNLIRPDNFKTVKLMSGGDNELQYINNKVNETYDKYQQEKNKNQEIQLANVIVYLGSKFIRSAIKSKYGYKNFLSEEQVPKTKCFEDDTVRACVFFNDINTQPSFKFINNPIDGTVSIKSKLNDFIDSVLSQSFVKDFYNKMENIEEKQRILEYIKNKVNDFLKDLRKQDRSDAFFIYFELGLDMIENDYNFKLVQLNERMPTVYLSNQETGGEMDPYNGDPVADCSFNPYGNKETECLKTCFENAEKINCDFQSCYNVCSKCEDPVRCKWLLDSEQNVINQACDFDANIDNIKDTTEVDCIKLCQRNENNNCSENVCKNLCSRCSNEETCSWIKTDREFAADIQNVDYPSPPIVTGVPGDKQITLSWNVNDNGGAPIEKFIFMAFKTNNHKEGMRVEVAHNNIENVNGRYYEHSIKELENDQNYTVSLAAVNKRGLSAMSKPLFIKPYKHNEMLNIGEDEDFSNTNTIQIDKKDEIIESIVEKLRTGDLNNINEEMKEITELNESLEKSKSKGMDLFSQLRKIGNIKLVSS